MCDGDVRQDMVIPALDGVGVTCEDIVRSARLVDETSDGCPPLQYIEALCCPSAASTCSICMATKLLADVEVVGENGATLTCGQVSYDAAEYDATSAECASHHDYEEYCCPDAYISTASTASPTSSASRYVFTFIYQWNIFIVHIC